LGFLVSAFVPVTLIMLFVDRSVLPWTVAPEIRPTPAPRGPSAFLPPIAIQVSFFYGEGPQG